jgi:hypothetical protein
MRKRGRPLDVWAMDGDDVLVNGKRITEADVKREAAGMPPVLRAFPAVAERVAYERLIRRAVAR